MGASQIAEVNHWRGQCLDNFARAEQAIITFIDRWRDSEPANAPTLAESASARSRNLRESLKDRQPSNPRAKRIIKLLELWSHRERDRNDLVHGIFTIKTVEDGWAVINCTMTVKKQVVAKREDLKTSSEAAAFLSAVIKERKALEEAFESFWDA